MNSNLIATMMSAGLPEPAPTDTMGVVEIGLLLPTKRAAALLKLAQGRQESVGQLLRKLIDRELAETV